jgi:hypothetical protein
VIGLWTVLLASAVAGLPALDGWEPLLEGDPMVECTESEGFPWCRSRTTLPFDVGAVEATLTDLERYPEVFLRVTSATRYSDDVAHIVLKMPFPLARRDYVAHFEMRGEGEARIIEWSAVDRPDVPVGRAVRLVNAAGQWHLEPVRSETIVTYTWNGELRGDMPKWALPRAWRVQGVEVLEWLGDALQEAGE